MRWGPAAKVWGLVAVITVAACGLSVGAGIFSGVSPTTSSWMLPWWLLAAGVTVAELLPVHLQIRRHAWSASLIEIPLVIGLATSSSRNVVVGQIVGCVIARGLINRQTAQKLVFNVALCALESSAAVIVFDLLTHGRSMQDPLMWVAAYAAVLVEGAVSTVGLAAVMKAVTGSLPSDLVANFVLGAVIVPAGGTALALEAVVTLKADVAATALMALVVGLLIVGYRAYAKLRARYASLQLLYQFTRAVQTAPEHGDVVDGLLEATRKVLDAETAELLLVDDTGRLQRRLAGVTVPDATSLETSPASWRAIERSPTGLLASRTGKTPEALRWLRESGWADGMVVPVHRDGQLIGTLAVANREGDVATFDAESMRLFETLANHATVSLQNTELITRLTFEASHDALTQLGNRAEFRRRLSEELVTRRPGQKIAVALIDLDRFKEINDTLGHHTGDQLLVWLGQRAAALLPVQAQIARLGGDEFALFVAFDGSKAGAATVIEELLRPLWGQTFNVSGVDVDVRASVGVAVAPDDAEDADTLLQRADVAMYTAKSAGTGHVAPYRAERDTNSSEKLSLAAELRTAITDRLLDVHFQPQVDLELNRVTSVEALVRWTHPKHGPLSPDVFIPLAERTGLIVPLTELVLDRSLDACVAWQTAGLELSVAVNVSVRSLADENIVTTVAELLARHRLSPSRLTLEVTESGVMEDERRNVGVLQALAQLGVRLSVDDFGTGYSSLAYLKRLPVNEVKIDKSFVMVMQDDPKDAAIVRSIIDLARHLGLAVVAEGVETPVAMTMLTGLGCSLAQGYHISRPVSATQIAGIAANWAHQTSDTHTMRDRLHAV